MRSIKAAFYLFTFIASAICDDIVDGKLSFYTSAWEGWDESIARWSAYEPPTFSAVFKPETEAELSQGVRENPLLPYPTPCIWSASAKAGVATLDRISGEAQHPIPSHQARRPWQCTDPWRL